MYLGCIWWHNLDVSIPTFPSPKTCISFWNIALFKIHSLDEFSISLEALPALVFKIPGRYSAVSLIWSATQNSHISFASWIMSRFLVSPFVLNNLMLFDCPFAHGLLDPFCICKMWVLQILLRSSISICSSCSTADHFPIFMSSEKKTPACLWYICVKSSTWWEINNPSHLTDLGLISTSLVPPCKIAISVQKKVVDLLSLQLSLV